MDRFRDRFRPVTKRSGKSCIVIQWQAAVTGSPLPYHWKRVAIRYDTKSEAKYAALRGRGHSHGRALRSVADRLLNVACAVLKNGALFTPHSKPKMPLAKQWGVPRQQPTPQFAAKLGSSGY
jgi:hypothetical protein